MRHLSCKNVVPVAVVGLLALVSGGCWAGGTMSKEILTKHPSVRWVYQCGGQVGLLRIVYPILFPALPAPVENVVAGLHAESGCAVVSEANNDGAVLAPWHPVWRLDLTTGRLTFGTPRQAADRELSPATGEVSVHSQGDPELGNVTTIDGRFVFLCPQISTSSFSYALDFLPSGSEGQQVSVRLLNAFFPEPLDITKAILTDDGILLLVSGKRYVICIDLDKLPQGQPAK